MHRSRRYDPRFAMSAVIVHVLPAVAVLLVLRRHRQSAGTAAHHAGEGEIALYGPWPAWPPEQLLHAVELGDIDHRLVLSHVHRTFPCKHTGVKRIAKDRIDRAEVKELAASSGTHTTAESPFVGGLVQQPPWSGGAGEHQAEHLLDKIEAFRIGNDRTRGGIGEVSDWWPRRAPSLGDLCTVSSTDILGEAVDVVFRETEEHGKHQLALRVVFEGVSGKAKVLDLAGIKQMNNAAAIDGISGKAVWVPADDAAGLAPLDPTEHLVEDGAARILGALRLLIGVHDVEVGRAGHEPRGLRQLRFEREHLTFLGVGGFAAVDEIVHVIGVSLCDGGGDCRGCRSISASAAKKSKRRIASARASSGVRTSPKSFSQHSMKDWTCSSLNVIR